MKSISVWPSDLLRFFLYLCARFTFLHNSLKAILPGIHESNCKQKKKCVEIKKKHDEDDVIYYLEKASRYKDVLLVYLLDSKW